MKSLIYFTRQIFKNTGIFLFFILSLISCSIANPETLGNRYEDDGIYYNPKKDKTYRADKEVYEYGSKYNEIINKKEDSAHSEDIGIGRYYFDQYGNGPEKTYYDQSSKNENENSSGAGLLNRNYSSDFGVKTGTNVTINNWGGLYGWNYPYYNYWGWGGYDPWFGWGRSYPYSGWSLGFSSLYGWRLGYSFGWGYPYYRRPYYFGYSPYHFSYSRYYYSRYRRPYYKYYRYYEPRYRRYNGSSHYYRPRYRTSRYEQRYHQGAVNNNSQYRSSNNTQRYRSNTEYRSSRYESRYHPSTKYRSSNNTQRYRSSTNYRNSSSRSYNKSRSSSTNPFRR